MSGRDGGHSASTGRVYPSQAEAREQRHLRPGFRWMADPSCAKRGWGHPRAPKESEGGESGNTISLQHLYPLSSRQICGIAPDS